MTQTLCEALVLFLSHSPRYASILFFSLPPLRFSIFRLHTPHVHPLFQSVAAVASLMGYLGVFCNCTQTLNRLIIVNYCSHERPIHGHSFSFFLDYESLRSRMGSTRASASARPLPVIICTTLQVGLSSTHVPLRTLNISNIFRFAWNYTYVVKIKNNPETPSTHD